MGFLDTIKGLVRKNADKVDDGIDKAGEMAKDKVPDQHDEKVDEVVDKAHEMVDEVEGSGDTEGGGGPETAAT